MVCYGHLRLRVDAREKGDVTACLSRRLAWSSLVCRASQLRMAAFTLQSYTWLTALRLSAPYLSCVLAVFVLLYCVLCCLDFACFPAVARVDLSA